MVEIDLELLESDAALVFVKEWARHSLRVSRFGIEGQQIDKHIVHDKTVGIKITVERIVEISHNPATNLPADRGPVGHANDRRTWKWFRS